jgi:hypothetical protein
VWFGVCGHLRDARGNDSKRGRVHVGARRAPSRSLGASKRLGRAIGEPFFGFAASMRFASACEASIIVSSLSSVSAWSGVFVRCHRHLAHATLRAVEKKRRRDAATPERIQRAPMLRRALARLIGEAAHENLLPHALRLMWSHRWPAERGIQQT